jgi:hypothetical protein
MRIVDNVIYTAGDGIRAGVDGLAIEGNEINGSGERSGDGIVLEEGIDPLALDRVRISGNRLLNLQGNGITINHRIEDLIVSANQFMQLGLGVLVMAEAGSAGSLHFAANQCRTLGRLANAEDRAFAALQLLRVERGLVCDNVIGEVARTAVASPSGDALRAAGGDQLRIAGNRLYGIGPDRAAGPVNAIHLLPPFTHTAVDENSVDRVSDTAQNAEPIAFRAVNIAPEPVGAVTHFAVASYIAAADLAYLLTSNRAVALPQRRAAVAIRANHLRGHASAVPLNQCGTVDDCLFSANQCEIVGEAGKEPILGLLAARTVNASNNRLRGPGDLQTLHLHPQVERAIVTGNTSSGPIVVQGGAPVPNDINLTNIFGV